MRGRLWAKGGSYPLAILFLLVTLATSAGLTIVSGVDAQEPPDLGPHVQRTQFDELFFPERSAIPSSLAKGIGDDVELGGFNESMVAVDPTNSMNIACASLWELRISTDGGLTFQPAVPTRIPDTHVFQGDPCVAYDSQGRLFWAYMGSPGSLIANTGIDVFVAQCDPTTGELLPGYPINVTLQIGASAALGHGNDKLWLAVDSWPGSPYQDRLYLCWTDFFGANRIPRTAFSVDQGLTWAGPIALGTGDTAFNWPTHIAVAPNGDVYATVHRQVSFVGGAPSGTSGVVRVLRSTNGGVSFPQSVNVVPAGGADMTLNRQDVSSGKIPGAVFLTQGSLQAWVLPDPLVVGRVSVVYADDPDNSPNVGDAADIFCVRSLDHGLTWSAPVRVDSTPSGTLQVMPNAAVDPVSGAILVSWYDNRAGTFNEDAHYLLDLYGAISLDGGASFLPDFQINDTVFDPDAGARCRYGCSPHLAGVWSSDPSLAFACGFGGVQRWNGSTWSVEPVGVTQPAFDIWGIDGEVWVVGVAGTIRHYDGSIWSSQSSGTTADLMRIDGRAADDIFAVGANGTILHFDGTLWSPQISGTTELLFGIWTLPGGTAWAVGLDGGVFHHDGVDWNSIGLVGDEPLLGVWASSDSDVWIAGQNGIAHHWDGAIWTDHDTYSSLLAGVWGSSSSDVYFGSAGGVLRWNGSAFERLGFHEAAFIDIHGSSSGDIFAVGEFSTIGHFDGTSWEAQDNPGKLANETLRIGEYNGIAMGSVGVVSWTGNSHDMFQQVVDQQAILDTISFDAVTGAPEIQPVAAALFLEPGAPNPFRWISSISYALPAGATATLSVHDPRGRLVRELSSGLQSAGWHTVTWDGRDGAGHTVGAGVYFVRLDSSKGSRVQKIVLER